MEDILDIDINKIVTKKIKEKISQLEKDNKKLQLRVYEQGEEILNLKKQNSKTNELKNIFDIFKKHFHEIKKGPEDNGGWYDSKQKLQFKYIEKIMLDFFGVSIEHGGWKSSRSDGALAPYLAVNFYSSKEILLNLLLLLDVDSESPSLFNRKSVIEFVKSFKMPYDYSKADVLKFVKSPQYNTNGCIFGASQYWYECGANEKNMPHDLIMRNPHILEDDIFESLLETVKSKRGEYHYLYALPKYNHNISNEQIEKLGETLIGDYKNCDHIHEFIKTNILKFNEKTLDFLFNKCHSNEWSGSILHWEKFPVKYQVKYLKSRQIDEILIILSKSKWSIEQKEEFLKQILNK